MHAPSPACGSSDKRNAEYLQNYSPDQFFKHFIKTEFPVIVDVGGHRGESVLFFNAIFPTAKIYSFEPDPDNFTELQRACAALKTEAGGGGASAIKKAAGDEVGTTSFYKQTLSHLGGLLPINKFSTDSLDYAGKAANQCLEVDVTTLDHFASVRNILTLDILKIDAQGYEVEVLRGARKILKKTTACSVEVSFYDFYERSSSLLSIEQEMQAAGMRLWDIAKLSKNPKNFRTDWAEFIYLRSTFPRV